MGRENERDYGVRAHISPGSRPCGSGSAKTRRRFCFIHRKRSVMDVEIVQERELRSAPLLELCGWTRALVHGPASAWADGTMVRAPGSLERMLFPVRVLRQELWNAYGSRRQHV